MPQTNPNHTKAQQFRLSQLTRDRLEALAAHHDLTRSDVIRLLIAQEHERVARLAGKKIPENSPATP